MKLKLLLCALLLTVFFQKNGMAQCSADFEENGGIAVIELESVSSLSNGWRIESSVSGASGNRFLAWRGNDSFNTPGNGTINYKVRINTAGTYRFVWRNRIGIIANSKPTTEHNDAWLRIPDADNFFARRSGSTIFPGGSGKTPNPNGASSGGWFKVYTNTIDWNWTTNTSDNDPHQIFATFNSPGVYTIQISGRSKGHFIDRMVLFQENKVSLSSATSLNREETLCGSGTPPPPPPPPSGDNEDPTVNITNPKNGQSFEVGNTVTINLAANDSDGSIVKHKIFVNGTLVDTDGNSYSPYQISNIAQGNYNIRARVVDDSGADAESSVNISVDSASDNDPPSSGGDNAVPTVAITNPTDGQSFEAGDAVTINLAANDSDGSIVKHKIFVNGTLVDTDGNLYTPHQISNIAQGNYNIRARVVDDSGADTETSVNIFVDSASDNDPPSSGGDNVAPTVVISNPADGENFSAGSTVGIDLSANDSDGSIVKHQIFVNGTLVDTDGSNFTPHIINNIVAGTYVVRALVEDNDGESADTQISFAVGGNGNTPPPPAGDDNIAPTVTIASPNDGQNFNVGSTVNVNLVANDLDGSIVKYQIFVNGKLVDTDGSNFTPHPIRNVIAGNYSVRAVVTDNEGATGESEINFTVGGNDNPSSGGNNIAPIVQITNPAEGQNFSPGSTVSVNLAAGDSDGDIVKYQIFVNGTLVDTDGTLFTPHPIRNIAVGNYEIRALVTDNQGTTAEDEIRFSVGSSSSALSKALAYPNPTVSGEFTVRIPENMKETVNYVIYNAAGAALRRGKVTLNRNKKQDVNLSLPAVSGQSSGVYYVVLTDSKGNVRNIPMVRR